MEGTSAKKEMPFPTASRAGLDLERTASFRRRSHPGYAYP